MKDILIGVGGVAVGIAVSMMYGWWRMIKAMEKFRW